MNIILTIQQGKQISDQSQKCSAAVSHESPEKFIKNCELDYFMYCRSQKENY